MSTGPAEQVRSHENDHEQKFRPVDNLVFWVLGHILLQPKNTPIKLPHSHFCVSAAQVAAFNKPRPFGPGTPPGDMLVSHLF